VPKVVINSEQIRFHQKRRVEAEEGPLSQVRAFICPEGNSEYYLESDFGVRTGLTLLTDSKEKWQQIKR